MCLRVLIKQRANLWGSSSVHAHSTLGLMPYRRARAIQIEAGCCSTNIWMALFQYESLCRAHVQIAHAVLSLKLRLLLYVHSQHISYEFLRQEFSEAYGASLYYREAMLIFNRQARAVEGWLSELLAHHGACAAWPRIASQLEPCFRRLHHPPTHGIPTPRPRLSADGRKVKL